MSSRLTTISSQTQALTARYSVNNWRKAELLLRVLNNPHVRLALDFLMQHDKPLSVTDLWIGLRWEQPTASQHLAKMRKYGIVNAERDGKFILYSVNYEKLDAINELFK